MSIRPNRLIGGGFRLRLVGHVQLDKREVLAGNVAKRAAHLVEIPPARYDPVTGPQGSFCGTRANAAPGPRDQPDFAHDSLPLIRPSVRGPAAWRRIQAQDDRVLARFAGADLLIIDDLGLRPLEYDEPVDLYEIIRQRYERHSTIITSNRDLAEWYPLFKDELLASAAMDRLLHHSHVVTLGPDPASAGSA